MDIVKIWNLAKRFRIHIFIIAIMLSLILWAPTIWANLSTRAIRYDLSRTNSSNIPEKSIAIVFGAGVYRDGSPTPYLKWRIETAVELYKAGRVKKLLMTGDNSSRHHDEPTSMGHYAESLGVDPKDITLDYAGFNTYDSCYRAKTIFGVSQAILVTQGYHLPRAVIACRGMGIDAIGVGARRDGRDWAATYIMREWVSTDKIMLQLLFKPKPTALGQTQPISYRDFKKISPCSIITETRSRAIIFVAEMSD